MTSEELRARQQIKDFAHQLDATSYILRRLKLPIHKLRDTVDGIQGAAGGRSEFDLSHKALARRLRHTGKDETAEAYARRKVQALDKAQREAGRMLFTITPGGGIEHKRTHYVDHLTPVANWMMQQARESEAWATHPGKAIESFVDAAVEMLPEAEPRESEGGGRPMSDDDYITRSESQLLGIAERIYRRTKDPEREARRISALLVTRAKEIANYKEIASAEELKQRAQERGARSELELSGVAARGAEGLQICDPPDAPTEGERLTNLSPSPAESGQNAEEKPDMFAAALGLAAKGFRVFPLYWIKADGSCSCPDGASCKSPGKHPRISEWQKLASTQESWLKGWFKRQWPSANVGIPTGQASGLLVIDFDFDKGGETTFNDWRAQHGDDWLDTQAVRTGGGVHLYYRHPQGVELRNTTKSIGEGVDTRSNGGFVVAPPSLHVSGRLYEWLNDLESATPPDWLLTLLTEGRGATAAPSGGKTLPQAKSGAGIGLVITEGNRNHSLFRIGTSMRGKGAELPEIEAELLDINARRCSPPLPDSEVLKVARSAASYPANRVAVGG